MHYAPAAHWDHVFRTLRQASADLDWGEQWVSAFAPMLHTHHVQRLLDLGCGTGNDVQRLDQRRYTVVGLDSSREASTQAARKAGARTALLVADMATPLPCMTGSVEAVMSNVALHMFDDARTWGTLDGGAPHGAATGPGAVPCQCAGRLAPYGPSARRQSEHSPPMTFWRQTGKRCMSFPPRISGNCCTGWGEVHLELIESAAHTTGEPFKCVWRECGTRVTLVIRRTGSLTATHRSPIRAGVHALCGSCPGAGGSPSISTRIRAEKGCAADALQPALRSGFPSCQHGKKAGNLSKVDESTLYVAR